MNACARGASSCADPLPASVADLWDGALGGASGTTSCERMQAGKLQLWPIVLAAVLLELVECVLADA